MDIKFSGIADISHLVNRKRIGLSVLSGICIAGGGMGQDKWTISYKNVTYMVEMSPDSMVKISDSLYNIQEG